MAKTRAFLVSNLVNIRYLSGVELSDGILLVTPKELLLFVDPRYTEAALDCSYPSVRVMPLKEFSLALKQFRSVGVEAGDLTIERQKRLASLSPRTKHVPLSSVVETLRRRKSHEELALIRKAEQRTRELLRAVPKMLRVGITERELAWKLQCLAMEHGADGMAFDTIIAFGEHTSRPHHRPTSRPLRRGDMVQADLGVRLKGYCGDLSDVFFTAPKSDQQRNIYGALKKAKKIGISLLKSGADNRLLDREVRAYLRTVDLEDAFTHALGHGVGLEVHEGVTLSARAPRMPLLRHEVVTVEPGVYFPGRFGMRLEDMAVVE